MTRFSSVYTCQQCGYQSPSFLGKCPECGSWNSMVEEAVETRNEKLEMRNKRAKLKDGQGPISLANIAANKTQRISTNISELDRVLGEGIVPGMVVLVAGEPGIGKSTLLLQLAANLANLVLYIAGEESASQIKIRAERLGISGKGIEVLEETDVDTIVKAITEQRNNVITLIIVDSVQTLTTADFSGQAGSVGQVRECASRLAQVCKQRGLPLFLVGHVTKEGTVAGPKVLEHLVDTVLYLEGDRFESLRLLRAVKNRFGPTDETGVFQMSDGGLAPVANPHELLTDLVSKRNGLDPGACLTVALEGTRPLVMEIQALVTATPVPNPRRVASGIDHNRLLAVVAVIQKRLNLPLYKEDVYVSVAGGFRVSEPGVDLAMALSIISSYQNKPLPLGTVAIGEVDLLGNVRRVRSLDKRVKEAKKLGFKNILTSTNLTSLTTFRF